ncbi:hypothetical protein RV11_GL002637 [Enterococcus phoeniculicola]|jgi:hypothetical protein|uniref:Uncharacterized protein n=1 Tax=Enterococcus phoeniculicola ATCC BAA-412 TaxID=1158610 RepID=R3TKI9_9ENTE|nr:hypothetical protein [Enterococcus phoeniculicola]EOL41929.1 hypothetical protein UC3_02277 [Enterococcus phoeniculicola ATCC BAA-412]EOT79792.1 hypothetical protein I589_01304 [Enterococcus phoeniculicola ATCC BAA-412]OJG69440.1 hypothetical protein RV11_GL002637 [Enterococcus phoeniculicola]
MRANDFLTAIVIPTVTSEYEGIFLQEKETYIPLARIDIRDHKLIFQFKKNAKQLPMKEIYTKLMIHKTFQLVYLYEDVLTPVYGFHQLENKLIL